MSTTDRNRAVFVVLFALVVLVGLAGWIWKGSDVAALEPLFIPLVAALGIGEAANVGKRATSKADVILADAEVTRLNGG